MSACTVDGFGHISPDEDGFPAVFRDHMHGLVSTVSFMSAMISFAPSRANVSAVALPIPDAPPVTNATFPSTRPGMLSPPAARWMRSERSAETVVARLVCQWNPRVQGRSLTRDWPRWSRRGVAGNRTCHVRRRASEGNYIGSTYSCQHTTATSLQIPFAGARACAGGVFGKLPPKWGERPPNKSFRKLAPASARAPASPASTPRWLRTPASRACAPDSLQPPAQPCFLLIYFMDRCI